MRVWFLACLSVGAILVAAVACYNPALQSPGLFCDPKSEPACPDGQVCSGNRCVDPRTVRGDGGTNNFDLGGGGGGGDMRGGGGRDLSPVGTGGCRAIITCGQACTTNSCIQSCYSSAPMTSQMKYSDALTCGQEFCVTRNRCRLDSVAGQYVDATGAPSGACDACLSDSTAALFGGTCAGTTYCNPASCQSLVDACLND